MLICSLCGKECRARRDLTVPMKQSDATLARRGTKISSGSHPSHSPSFCSVGSALIFRFSHFAGRKYFPPARCGNSTHRAEVGGGNVTGLPPRSRCPGRPGAGFPWLFTIYPPSPFLQDEDFFMNLLLLVALPDETHCLCESTPW